MTRPTITTSTTKYALFRKGVISRMSDNALQDQVYDTYPQAVSALQKLRSELAVAERSLVEIRVVEDDPAARPEFGKNPFAWYTP